MNEDQISMEEIVFQIKSAYNFLSSKRILIILVGLIGGILGVVYSLTHKPLYTAECTFVLEDGEAGALGSYSGIASMVGIDIGGGGSNGIFKGENIFQLYKSRLMIEKTLLKTATFDGKKMLLIDRYIESNNLRALWDMKQNLKHIKFTIPKEKFTLSHDSIISNVVTDIKTNYLTVEKVDKKLSIVSVKVRSRDELFAKMFTEKIVENVNDFYVQTKTKKSLENVQVLQKQADSVRRALNASIGGTASAIDENPNANPAFQILRVPSQRRQVDVQASAAIYEEVVKNLEISKISLRKEAPLIQVIDMPILPLKKKETGIVKATIIGTFLSVISIVVALLCKRYYVIITTPSLNKPFS